MKEQIETAVLRRKFVVGDSDEARTTTTGHRCKPLAATFGRTRTKQKWRSETFLKRGETKSQTSRKNKKRNKMMNISKTILATGLFLLTATTTFTQTSATYDEVISKQKKGQVDKYITQNGEEFKVGDTINLGVAFRNEQFDFIQQNAGIAYYPLPNTASNSQVVIKKINISMKTVLVNTTKPQGFVYGLTVINFESAIKNGEIISKIMSSDQALAELKKWKDKLDLGIITEEEYNKKKEELLKYIK